MLGMLLPEDEKYLWVAEESLLAPLPEGKLFTDRAVVRLRWEGENMSKA